MEQNFFSDKEQKVHRGSPPVTFSIRKLHFYILYMQDNMFTFKTVASNSKRKRKKLVFISDFKKLLQCKNVLLACRFCRRDISKQVLKQSI